MKQSIGIALAGLVLLANCAHAAKTMAEREEAQTIVVAVEVAAFITIVAVLGFVWRLSTREAAKRKAKAETD
jgi:heme/copper-type cytochrome/quinol oxidase subunit 2